MKAGAGMAVMAANITILMVAINTRIRQTRHPNSVLRSGGWRRYLIGQITGDGRRLGDQYRVTKLVDRPAAHAAGFSVCHRIPGISAFGALDIQSGDAGR